MEKKKLEEIAEDPLAIFDHINERAWKDPKEPEIVKLISETRERIASEPERSQQYLLVAGYMAVLRQKATGKTDFFDMFQQTISRMGYFGDLESMGPEEYN